MQGILFCLFLRVFYLITEKINIQSKITDILSNLKKNKAPGLDAIHSETLQAIKNYISIPICHLINIILNESIFSVIHKETKIKPLFKKRRQTGIMLFLSL